jgi:CRP-like cAMP-binding protein
MYDPLLQSISRYVPLSPEDEALICSQVTARRVRKGQFLVHEGAVSRSTIFINKGSIRTYFIDLDGNEHIIQLGIEGWWIGDLQSYTTRQPAKLNVVAMEDSEVLEIEYERHQYLYEHSRACERYFRILMQQALVAFQQRMLQNLCMTAEERYRQFVDQYAMFALRIPQKYVASYLGMTPEFLSKVKRRVMTGSRVAGEGARASPPRMS